MFTLKRGIYWNANTVQNIEKHEFQYGQAWRTLLGTQAQNI